MVMPYSATTDSGRSQVLSVTILVDITNQIVFLLSVDVSFLPRISPIPMNCDAVFVSIREIRGESPF